MKILLRDILQLQVSYYTNVKLLKDKDITVEDVFRGIKGLYFKQRILSIRKCIEENEINKAKDIKGNLPAVTFSGIFNGGHRFEQLVRYNNVIILDIDNIESDKLYYVRECLENDPHVIAFWKSPSGSGYKGIVTVDYNNWLDNVDIRTKHKMAFRYIYNYFLNQYGIELDKSGSDLTRLCYFSYDPDICIKEASEKFNIERVDEPKAPSKGKQTAIKVDDYINVIDWNIIYGKSQQYNRHQEYRTKLASIIKKLKKRQLSITQTYEEWVRVAYAIASNIHPIIGRKMFLELCEMDGIYYDEQASEKLIFDAYTKTLGRVGFASIIYLAKQKGLEI